MARLLERVALTVCVCYECSHTSIVQAQAKDAVHQQELEHQAFIKHQIVRKQQQSRAQAVQALQVSFSVSSALQCNSEVLGPGTRRELSVLLFAHAC